MATTDLLRRAKNGEETAVDRILERYLPRLRRWAGRRLPGWARRELDTDDLVQETLMRTVARADRIQATDGGGFQAYVRRVLDNRIRDELRRSRRRPDEADLPEDVADGGRSPLEEIVGREALATYEAALVRLGERDRAAIVARFELGLDYRAVAVELDKPSANAARMAVTRAVERLVREMSDGDRAR